MRLDEPLSRETLQFLTMVLLVGNITLASYLRMQAQQRIELARRAGLSPEQTYRAVKQLGRILEAAADRQRHRRSGNFRADAPLRHESQPRLCQKCEDRAHIMAEAARRGETLVIRCRCAGEARNFLAVASTRGREIARWSVLGPLSDAGAQATGMVFAEQANLQGLEMRAASLACTAFPTVESPPK